MNHNESSSQAEKRESNEGAPLQSDSNGSNGKPPSSAQEDEENKKPKKKLPPFFDHFNKRDLKILFRCSLAFWVASLFLFIDPILNTFGQATFFAGIAVLFLPPSGVVLVILLGGSTEILGMALGWVWGVITQKAALATRPSSETNARLAQLAQQAQTTGTPVTNLIFQGFMLDTRVTVTYFCMICFFIYMMVKHIRLHSRLTFVLTRSRLDFVRRCPSLLSLLSSPGLSPTYG